MDIKILEFVEQKQKRNGIKNKNFKKSWNSLLVNRDRKETIIMVWLHKRNAL
jgi:hypothetical protein